MLHFFSEFFFCRKKKTASLGDWERKRERRSIPKMAQALDANVPKTLSSARLLMNASVVQILSELKKEAKRSDPNAQQLDVFEKALTYATRFSGAISAPEQASFTGMVGELEDALQKAQLTLRTEDGSDSREGLSPYECSTLANLNPPTPDAARQLLPTLERFTEDSLQELLKAVKRVALSGFGGGGSEGAGEGGGAGGGGGGLLEE